MRGGGEAILSATKPPYSLDAVCPANGSFQIRALSHGHGSPQEYCSFSLHLRMIAEHADANAILQCLLLRLVGR